MSDIVKFPNLGIEVEYSKVLLSINGHEIMWYGVLICLALLLCVGLGFRVCEKHGLTKDDLMDYILITVPCSILGARLYYVIFSWDSYKDNLSEIFKIWNGGLAIYGGIIVAVLCVVIIGKVKKHKIMNLIDFMLPYICLGQAIGRWGNFFNQEAYGGATELPWGMTGNLISEEFGDTLVHPTFLYESLWCFLAFAVMMLLKKKMTMPGQMTALYFIFYGAERTLVEGLRTDSLMLGPVRVSQVLSALLFFAGIVILVMTNLKKKEIIADESVEDENSVSRLVKAMEEGADQNEVSEEVQQEKTQEDTEV